MIQSKEALQISIDVGCYQHAVAIGLSNGDYLGQFEIDHNKKGFDYFFEQIDYYKNQSNGEVFVAMEGYNGHARPLDQMILSHHYHLMNINNLKLARFKEIFPSPAKTDHIDARKGLELFQLQQTLPLAKGVLQEVFEVDEVNTKLKMLTRRRKRFVEERVRCANALHADLRAVAPGLVDITGSITNHWFLNFLNSSDDLQKLTKKRTSTLLKIDQVGVHYVKKIQQWQQSAIFSENITWLAPLIKQDVQRIQALTRAIAELTEEISLLLTESEIGQRLKTIGGFGDICSAEIAGEIGSIKKFEKEGSLALYLGMVALDNSSGKYKGAKQSKQVNHYAKRALMTAVNKHRQMNKQSQRYYEKKRKEGKKHNQALRSLGRHLCRVIYQMLSKNRDYYIEDK